MPADLATIRGLMRNAAPKTILVIAPDVYEQLATGQPLEEAAIRAVERGVSVRLGPDTMEKGTVILMAAAELPAPQDWAGKFLNKGGPAATGVLVPYETKIGKQKPPKPQVAPVQPPAPQQTPPVRKTRQRIVDT